MDFIRLGSLMMFPDAVRDPFFFGHVALPGLTASVRLVSSDLPAFSIWKTNREDLEVKKVSLESGGEVALLHRPQMEVRYRRLSPAELVFLEVISAGRTFEAASSAVADQFPGAEPAPIFIALLKEGVFKGLN